MSTSGREPPAPPSVDALLGCFLDELRRGADPDIDDYVSRCPERADELRDVLSAAKMMDDAGRPTGGSAGSRVTADGRAIRQLGDYRIVREVGRGGMGVVYEAIQESLGRRVALKVLPYYAVLDRKRVDRFRAEAKAVGSLQHPHIVAIYAVGDEDGIHYYTMQFIEGQPVHEVLREVRRLRETVEGTGATRQLASSENAVGRTSAASRTASRLLASPVDPDSEASRRSPSAPGSGPSSSSSAEAGSEPSSALLKDAASSSPPRTYYRSAARLALHVAEALAYAHDRGVLHRDIKPANLLLDVDGHVWITDFGLAKAKDSEDLTQTGDVVGTLAYLAPESLKGWTDPRSEVYSLGITLYEILTLRPAFRDSSHRHLVKKIAADLPPAPRRIDPRIPVDLETVVLKAIEKEPSLRYGSAAELAADLRAFLEDRDVKARRSTLPERFWRWCRRNPGIAATSAVAAACFLLAVLGVFVALWLRNERNDAEYWRNLAEAREYRASIEPGRKLASRERVRRAAELLGALWLPRAEREERILRLRRELVAAEAQVDLRDARILPGADLSGGRRIAFGPAYEVYARREDEETVRVRRLADDSVVSSLSTPPREPSFLLFSRRCRYLAARFNDSERTFRLWELESGREKVRATSVIDNAIDVSSDETMLALAVSASSRRVRVLLYDLAGGDPPRRLGTDEGPVEFSQVYTVCFHPDGGQLAVSAGREVKILNLDDGRELAALAHDTWIRGIAWQPGGKLLAAAGSDFKIHVWNVPLRTKQAECKGHSGEVIHVGFHPGGDLLASHSWDGTFRLWEAYGGAQRVRLTQRPIDSTLHFSRDGRYFSASALGEEGVRLWELAPCDSVTALHGHHQGGKSPLEVDYAPDGRWLVTCGDDGVAFWESGTGRELGFIPVRDVRSVHLSPDGDGMIVSSRQRLLRYGLGLESENGRIRLNPGPGRLLFPSTSENVDRAALDVQGRHLAVFHSGHVDVVDLEREAHLVSLSGHENATFVDISPDRKLVATGTWHGRDVVVWDATTGQRVRTLPPKESANVRFSPAGDLLAVSEFSRYRVWEVGSWRERFAVERDRYNVPVPAAFSPDGRFLAVTDSPETVLVVDGHTGRRIMHLEPPVLHDVAWLDFSPDGSRLAVATTNHLAWEWNLAGLARELASVGLGWNAAPPGETRERGEIVFERTSRVPDVNRDIENAMRYYCGYQRVARALKANPEDSDALRAREQTLRKWIPLAVDRLVQAIHELTEAGKYDGVLQAYDRLLAIDLDARQRAYHQNNLAWLYVTSPRPFRDYERAIAIAREALAGDPENRYVRNTLGVACYRAGRYAEAREALQSSLEKGTDYPVYDWLFLSMCCSREKDVETAREMFRKAAEWLEQRGDLQGETAREIREFRAEAAGLLDEF